MTCKDCIYSPICKLYADFGVTDVPYDENDTCKLFRSKVDLVEVVRCSECRHWGGVTFGFVCRKFSGEHTKICMHKDDFCSYGEKRDESTL